MFSQDVQTWCHLPSFADIEVALQPENFLNNKFSLLVKVDFFKTLSEPLKGRSGKKAY